MKTIEDLALEIAQEIGESYSCEDGEYVVDPIDFATKFLEAWQAQQDPVGYVGKHIAHAIHGGSAGLTTITRHMAFDDDVAIYLAPPPAIPEGMDVLGRSMVWTSASNPPDVTLLEYGWLMSERVLGITKHGKMQVVIYEQVDEDCAPRWKTDCSEGWDVTQELTHWMNLPQPPAQGEQS